MSVPAEERFLWIPGWSAAPQVFAEELARWPGAQHTLVDFTDCVEPEQYLEQVRRALAEAGGRARLVGWSLGALLALELALCEPEQVLSLHLIAATGRFVRSASGEPGWSERALRRTGERHELEPLAVLGAFWRRMLSERELAAGWLERWLERNDPPPAPALRAGLTLLGNLAPGAEAHRIGAPVFLLHGGEDAIVPIGAAVSLAGELPRASLTVAATAGHAPFLTEPERFHDWLATSLAG